VATYEDVYKLTYVRGPSGILVMLAEELKKSYGTAIMADAAPRHSRWSR
jgi:hypothetical protein